MFNVGNDIIPIILTEFKVNNIIISGSSNDITENVIEYCDNNGISYFTASSTNEIEGDLINHENLNVINDFKDYDAIFINGDPNWYTVFHELNNIYDNNEEFPLVFFCNNVFPHKRRDTYFSFDIIPPEYINEYSDKLDLGDGIFIKDGFYHAIHENTPKNGVLTAIEDFLDNHDDIGMMDLKLTDGITILFPISTINQIRIDKINKRKSYRYDDYDHFDIFAENKLLKDYVDNFNKSEKNIVDLEDLKLELVEKNNLINEYEVKLDNANNEIMYKDSKLHNLDSKLNLNSSQIKKFKSQLYNNELEMNDMVDKIQSANSEISHLKNELSSTHDDFEAKINIKEDELNEKEIYLNYMINQFNVQLSKLDTKNYCIKCFKDEISNNKMELKYYKDNGLIKKIISPLSYIYLIFKSNSNEVSLNIKLYKLLRNSNCFDIGYYLKNNPDLINSKWCKYFSPELHYVCYGFNENRDFNKKFFIKNTKLELLNYLIKCIK
ncbi:hypothetical protein [uncultured Methanobrevibacter sp.]|uniref:hypothetical protein n=1 Tax=uncultured Methanobrevibacter sp. TaxID=253161 RepID=UPI0025F89C67|nr:hypothetical protein [uncultured Methanobrevibacter sp.]